MFRSISLETVPEREKDGFRKQKTLLLEFTEKVSMGELKNQLENHGCGSFDFQGRDDENQNPTDQSVDNRWEVKFKNPAAAHSAYENLKSLEGVSASFLGQAEKTTLNKNTASTSRRKTDSDDCGRCDLRIGNILLTIGFILFVPIFLSVTLFQSNASEVSLLHIQTIIQNFVIANTMPSTKRFFFDCLDFKMAKIKKKCLKSKFLFDFENTIGVSCMNPTRCSSIFFLRCHFTKALHN